MGKYLNQDLKGNDLGRYKVEALLESGAKQITEPDKFDQYPDMGIICVADNGPFEAAGYAYNQSELDAFKHPDPRRKTWLMADRQTIEQYAS